MGWGASLSGKREAPMRSIALAVVLSLALVPAAFAKDACRDAKGHFAKCPPPAIMSHHPVCKMGKPCGNSCIAKDKVCHR